MLAIRRFWPDLKKAKYLKISGPFICPYNDGGPEEGNVNEREV